MEVVLPMEGFFAEYKSFSRDSESFLRRRQIGGTGNKNFSRLCKLQFFEFEKKPGKCETIQLNQKLKNLKSIFLLVTQL